MTLYSKDTDVSLSSLELSEKYDLPLEITKTALSNLQNGSAMLLTISGKIGAGKDTVAPIVLDGLNISERDRFHDFFARPLKEEINEIIFIINMADDIETATFLTEVKHSVPNEKAAFVIETLWESVKSGAVTTGYDRTPVVRTALQYWGTETRRAQDDNYWIKKALSNALTLIAEGKTVYVTDSRFPNEVAAVADAHGVTIRLTVSPEEQERRINSRDGLQISESARNHVSELALDDYTDFHVIVDTDTLNAHEVAHEVTQKVMANDWR